MSRSIWLGLIATVILIIACFFPWVTIAAKNIVVSGVEATGTTFGKPGYFNFVLSVLYLLFLFINKQWAKKAALFFAAFNLAWSVRNFLTIPICSGGICPEKQPAIYVMVVASVVMLLAVMLTKAVVKQDESL